MHYGIEPISTRSQSLHARFSLRVDEAGPDKMVHHASASACSANISSRKSVLTRPKPLYERFLELSHRWPEMSLWHTMSIVLKEVETSNIENLRGTCEVRQTDAIEEFETLNQVKQRLSSFSRARLTHDKRRLLRRFICRKFGYGFV